MLPLIFRKLGPGGVPGPGECWARSREKGPPEGGLSRLVLEHGPDALQQGPDPKCVVIDVGGIDPTFDAMLAATLAARRLGGEPVDDGYRAFAHYAGLILQGLEPAGLPPDQSIEGIYLAARNLDGSDLTDPRISARFLQRWERLFARIAEAVAKREDPFTTPLFAVGATFAEERAYLRKDEDLYRADVQHGRRWRARLPGRPAPASVLFLHKPKSLMFKYWCRRDRQAPVGGKYHLLVVDWGKGVWVMTTEPADQLSLRPLAEVLRKLEPRADPAAESPWVTGAGERCTIVASWRGTRLSDRAVLAAVKAWTRPLGVPYRALAVAGLGAALVAAAAVWFLWPPPPEPSVAWETPELLAEDKQYLPEVRGGEAGATFALPPTDKPRRVLFQVELLDEHPRGGDVEAVLQVNDGPALPLRGARGSGGIEFDPLRGELAAGANTVRVRLQGLADRTKKDPDEPAVLLTCWGGDRLPPSLYVLAIGVSDYQDPSLILRYAARDAEDLADAFKEQEHQLFRKVVTRVLVNGDATRGRILKELRDLVEEVARGKGRGERLLIVSFSGHGEKDADRFGSTFFFIPHEFQVAKDPLNVAVSASELTDLLNGADCPVVVFVDACHSGDFLRKKGLKAPPNPEEVRDALRKLAEAPQGVIVLPACAKDRTTREDPATGHGLLTDAVLKAIRRPSAKRVLFLNDLYDEVRRTMEKAEPGVSLPAPQALGGVKLDSIPIAVRDGPAGGDADR